MPDLTYRDAINLALAEEMRRDPKVLLMGEDVAAPGGIFKITQGLLDEFGPERVRDTPISETAFVGAALGLAVTGYRPVVELMFSDFLGVCFDQIVNSIAKHRFMSGGSMAVPLVIRMIGGGGVRFGAQHSQTGESWLLPIAGLKIVAASSPAEAHGLLKAAIRDDNPVVVIEHKGLLGEKGPVREGDAGLASLEGPSVVRPGNAATIVASLAMVPRALAAAEILAGEGVETEVIDLRVLRPMNVDPIAESLTRTGRLVTVEEQHRLGGWGAQVVAELVEQGPGVFKAPPRRITLPEHPLPFSPPLEDAALPNAERIAEVIRQIL
ncbi:MAG: pyruvate dehydrogenase complex E1 component subunit beta [Kiloniellales bacterium]|nr:pyruvate dehydrogenase complex E1 component subunit beta [Kiloniellales bacterium]